MLTFQTIIFCGDEIEAWVTDEPNTVSIWIRSIEYANRSQLDNFTVGLDVECRLNYKSNVHEAAILQLCVGRNCLVFQLLRARCFPESLRTFLANPKYTFVGVGVDEDARKLRRDHGLAVSRTADVRALAVERFGNCLWAYKGLKQMGKEVLGKELEKPRLSSAWDEKELSPRQVEYASLDAFVSFQLGKTLRE